MGIANMTNTPIVSTERGGPKTGLEAATREDQGICGIFPEFAGFWDDPGESVTCTASEAVPMP